MRLIGSDYAFEEKLDKQALNEINSECAREMDDFKNGFAVLQGAYAPFGGLLKNLAQNWDETKIAESISKSFSNLDMSVFSKLE
ncbi:hypothetical protein [Sulfurimonas sp.]|uniref:hypothetical protein n=1 Tax=Sulfurimonas sp. TaxID=2022749 RepID=UPI003D10E4F2